MPQEFPPLSSRFGGVGGKNASFPHKKPRNIKNHFCFYLEQEAVYPSMFIGLCAKILLRSKDAQNCCVEVEYTRLAWCYCYYCVVYL